MRLEIVSLACLSDDDVADYVRGTTPAERVAAIVCHVERCGPCHERIVAMVRATRVPTFAPNTVEAWLARRAARSRR